MRHIPPHNLYLGHIGDASNTRLIRETGIAALVDLAANEKPVQVSRDTVYLRFPLTDGGGDSRALLRAAIEATAALIRSGTPTLVFCSAGMSRTPAVAAAALALVTGLPPQECLALVTRDTPADVSPRLWADVLAALAVPPSSPS